jgi:hypothetical protein
MTTNDPVYQKAYHAEWYEANKETRRASVNTRIKKLRKENQDRIIEYLRSHPCVDCGETDIVVLEFDHVRGVKKEAVGIMARSYTWAAVAEEISKCEVRCANDHARKTAIAQKNFKLNAGVSFNR